jgi:hypothetical protein
MAFRVHFAGEVQKRLDLLSSHLAGNPTLHDLQTTSRELAQIQQNLSDACRRIDDVATRQFLSRLQGQCAELQEMASLQITSTLATASATPTPSNPWDRLLTDLTEFNHEMSQEIERRGGLSADTAARYRSILDRFREMHRTLVSESPRTAGPLHERICQQIQVAERQVGVVPSRAHSSHHPERRAIPPTVRSEAPSSSVTLQGGSVRFAARNQFNDYYDSFYRGACLKRSACTPIAGFFARDMLGLASGGPVLGLDRCMDEGQRLMARESEKGRAVEHLSFEEIAPSFPEMAYLRDKTQDIILTPDTRSCFRTALQVLTETQQTRGLGGIACVLSGRGESYAVGIVSNQGRPTYYFLDSHGHRELMGRPEGYCICFDSLEKLVDFLSKRCPYLEGDGLEYYNYMNMYPLVAAEAVAAPVRGPDPKIPTEVTVRCRVPFGHHLFIRGGGEGLSWEKGIPLLMGEEGTWKLPISIGKEVEYKVLYDDVVWEDDGNRKLSPGENAMVLEPRFTLSAEQAKPVEIDPIVERPRTQIVVRFDAGYGNRLFLRGEGAPGLSWERGVEMRCVGENLWVWETDRGDLTGLKFKVLKNDRDWEKGDNHQIRQGERQEILPRFS